MDRKKTLTILILAVWTSLMAFGQRPLQTDWQIDELKGKVKSLKTTTYDPIDIFGTISNGQITDWAYREYDNKGNITKIQMPAKVEEEAEEEETFMQWLGVEEEAEAVNDTTTYTYIYQYNNEKIIEFDKLIHGITKSKFVYKYDNIGRITHYFVYNVSDTTLISKSFCLYGKNGKKCTQLSFTPSGLLYLKTVYNNYNNQYCRTKVYEYEWDGELISKLFYKYNNKGVPLKIYYYYYAYKNIGTGICNSKGDISEIKMKNSLLHYVYQYDSNGNWIEEIKTKMGKNTGLEIIETITTREIEYYE
jgi:hypothetical protein